MTGSRRATHGAVAGVPLRERLAEGLVRRGASSPRVLRALEYLLMDLCSSPEADSERPAGPRRLMAEREADRLFSRLGLSSTGAPALALQRYHGWMEDILACPGRAAIEASGLLESVRSFKYELGPRYLCAPVIKAAVECLSLIEELRVEPGEAVRHEGPESASARYRLPVEGPAPLEFPTMLEAEVVESGNAPNLPTPGYQVPVPEKLARQIARLASLEDRYTSEELGRATAHDLTHPSSPARSGRASRGAGGGNEGLEPAGEAAGPGMARRHGREAARGHGPGHREGGHHGAGIHGIDQEEGGLERAGAGEPSIPPAWRKGWLIWTGVNLLAALVLAVMTVLSPAPPAFEQDLDYQAYDLAAVPASMPFLEARRHDGTLIITASEGWEALPVSARGDLVRHLEASLIGRDWIRRVLILDADGRQLGFANPDRLHGMEQQVGR